MYEFHYITTENIICLVDINKFVSVNLPQIDVRNFRIKKSVNFKTEQLAPWFHLDEINKLNSFPVLKRQVEWMCGRLAVKKVLKYVESKAPDENEIMVNTDENGAPYPPESFPYPISISHSNDYAAAALCKTRDKQIGFDLEKVENKDLAHLLESGFTLKERQIMDPDEYSNIYKNWTIKEAYLKLLKVGFNEPLNSVEIINNSIIHKGKHIKNIEITSFELKKNYIFTLCSSKESL